MLKFRAGVAEEWFMADTTDYEAQLGFDEPLSPEFNEWMAEDSEKGFFWGDTSEFDNVVIY